MHRVLKKLTLVYAQAAELRVWNGFHHDNIQYDAAQNATDTTLSKS